MAVALEFKDKAVLVTGGSRGIGAATVRLFAEAGARVAFNYRSARDAAEALVAECGGAQPAKPEPGEIEQGEIERGRLEHGGVEGGGVERGTAQRCVALEQSLGTAEEGVRLVERAVEVWGRLDALVVNHGVWPPHDAPIDRMALGQWRGTMGINLDSVFGLVQAAVAQMKKQQGGGYIVLVASTAAQRGEAFHADYAASKGALISLTKSLSSELAGEGIRVNCVAPGWVATDMSAPALATEAGRAKIFGTIPMGRVGTPEEIAGPILFLCTPWAGFCSGEVLNVNGGAVLVG
jgi:3-oxoacyl-[acyl-carrier protein] reductase